MICSGREGVDANILLHLISVRASPFLPLTATRGWPSNDTLSRDTICLLLHDRDGASMRWLLIGYMFLFIDRPFEVWQWLGDLHVERIYMLFTLAVGVVYPHKRW